MSWFLPSIDESNFSKEVWVGGALNFMLYISQVGSSLRCVDRMIMQTVNIKNMVLCFNFSVVSDTVLSTSRVSLKHPRYQLCMEFV